MIKVENITVGYYQDVYVLQDVSLEVSSGQITCIIGSNGAGKSTLLKTIYGFLHPKVGKVLFKGRDITRLSPYEMLSEGIAYIPQEKGVLPDLTVEENLQLGAWLFRHDKRQVRKKIGLICDRFPVLHERRHVKAGRLSGGEQRMLEIGRVLMSDPKAILFDEPTAGLAPKVAEEIYDQIRQLKERGQAIILVEQNVRRALSLSDYAYVFELGKVKLEGASDQVDLKKAVAPWLSA